MALRNQSSRLWGSTATVAFIRTDNFHFFLLYGLLYAMSVIPEFRRQPLRAPVTHAEVS